MLHGMRRCYRAILQVSYFNTAPSSGSLRSSSVACARPPTTCSSVWPFSGSRCSPRPSPLIASSVVLSSEETDLQFPNQLCVECGAAQSSLIVLSHGFARLSIGSDRHGLLQHPSRDATDLYRRRVDLHPEQLGSSTAAVIAITFGLVAERGGGYSWSLFFIVCFYLGVSLSVHIYIDALIVVAAISPLRFAELQPSVPCCMDVRDRLEIGVDS